jgi:hypothetical protein
MRKTHLCFLLATLFILAVLASSCCLASARRSPQATTTPRTAGTNSTLPTATLVRPLTTIPKPLATAIPQQTKAEPTKLATAAPGGPLVLVDPPLDDLSPTLAKLPLNGQFTVLLHEQYVSAQAAAYIAAAQDLPVQISDVLVTFAPGAIEISGRAPLGFLRVEVLGRGTWRAESCRFIAEITEVRIAGQPAPASLRDQMSKLLQDALSNIANAPVCFTQVEIRRGEVEISGYRK